MSRLDFDKIAKNLAAKTGTAPAVGIHSYEIMKGTNVARVICSFSHDAGQDGNLKALTAKFNGSAQPIELSFRRINSHLSVKQVLCVGYVAANRIVEELTQERAERMTTIAKNVLMDKADGTTWDFKELPSGTKYISKQDTENLSELLEASYTRRPDIKGFSAIASADPKSHNYVSFVWPETASVLKGFVLSSDETSVTILPKGMGDTVTVARELVVEVAKGVEQALLDKEEASDIEPDKLKEYYGKLYSYDPKYLSEVDNIIDKHAAL